MSFKTIPSTSADSDLYLHFPSPKCKCQLVVHVGFLALLRNSHLPESTKGQKCSSFDIILDTGIHFFKTQTMTHLRMEQGKRYSLGWPLS